MSEGNASVEVAALKAEIEINLDAFEEGLDNALDMYENFAESVREPLDLGINLNGLDGIEAQLESIKEALDTLTGVNINEDISSDGAESTIDILEKLKELSEEFDDGGISINVHTSNIEEVISELREVRAMQESLDNSNENLRINVEDIDSALSELELLKNKMQEDDEPIKLHIDTSGIREAVEDTEEVKDAEDEVASSAEKMSDSLGSSIYAFQMVFSSLERIAESSVEGFAQLQISANIANREFGRFGANIQEFSKNSVQAFGLTNGQALHYIDTLGLALKSQGANNKQASEMSKSLLGVADNLVLASGGTMNMQSAIQVLTSAMAGQTFGLKNLGINITGVNKAWTPLHQAMYIMSQVTTDVNRNFGSLGQNMNTTAGAVQRAQATLGEFGDSIGRILAPQLEEVDRMLEDMYQGWSHLSSSTKHIIVDCTEIGLGILGVVSAIAVLDGAIKVLGGVLDMMEDSNPILLAIQLIIVAVVALYEAWKHNWLGIRKVIDESVKDIENVLKKLEPVFKEAVKFFEKCFDEMKPAFHQFARLFKDLLPIISPIVKMLGVVVLAQLEALVLIVEATAKIITGTVIILGDVVKGVLDGIDVAIKFGEDTFRSLRDVVSNVCSTVSNVIHDTFNDISNFFHATIPGWIHFIVNWFNDLPVEIEYALGYALGTITKWVEDVYNCFSSNIPRWISDIGNWFEELPGRIESGLLSALEDIVTWGEQIISSGERTASGFIRGVVSWFEQLPSDAIEILDRVIEAVITWGSELISTGEEDIEDFCHGIVSILSNLPSEMVEIGENIVHGICAGIESGAGAIFNEVDNIKNRIVDGFKSALDIHSPSRIMASEIGIWIPAGIQKGIEDGMPSLVDFLHSSVHGLTKIKPGMNLPVQGVIPPNTPPHDTATEGYYHNTNTTNNFNVTTTRDEVIANKLKKEFELAMQGF